MPRDSSPTIKEFKVRAVRVPMTEPHRTASGVITESPLVLTDIVTDTGITGHSMVLTYTPAALKPTAELICNLEPLVKGELLAPIEIEQKLAKRFRLLGTQGLVGIALAAIDMALWDALARVNNLCSCGRWAGRRSLFALTARSAMTASKVAQKPPKAGRREDLRESTKG